MGRLPENILNGRSGGDAQRQLRRWAHAWLHDLRCGAWVIRLGDHLRLPDLEKDKSCDEDDDQDDARSDDYGQKAGVAFAFFRGGITL
jgi:hypothetical protein